MNTDKLIKDALAKRLTVNQFKHSIINKVSAIKLIELVNEYSNKLRD